MGIRQYKSFRKVGKGNKKWRRKKNWKGKTSLSRNIEDANIHTKREVENKINPRNYQKNKKTDKGSCIEKKKKETEGKQENKKK